MADEEVAQINEHASQLLSESQPAAPSEPSEVPVVDSILEPIPTKAVPAEPAAAPVVVEQAAPQPEESAAPLKECEAPKVQVQPDAPVFKPIIASPKLQKMAASPAVTNGFTNGSPFGQTNGFTNGQTNGFTNGYTNGFNGLSTPSPAPISNNLEITLNKEEGQTWGFRVGGGREFGLPLSVNRIQYGGLAEKQGVQVQDVVLEINGMNASDMTHAEALDAIKKAGNTCLFSLSRSEASRGKMMRPYRPMVPLDDMTVAQPISGMRPTLSTPVIAAATMRNVALGTINAEQAETCFTEEVIAETMSSHAEVVVGNALGVNFHKFEPKYDHLALSGVYKLLLEEEQRRGRTMELPTSIKPQVIAKKGPAKAPSPLPPPKAPTPPPKEPTPPPKEPTPPPKEPTPPPKEPTPPPKEATPPPPEPEPTPVEEPEQQQVEAPAEIAAVQEPAPVEPEQNTNGVNGDDPELVAIEQAVQKQPAPAPAPPAPEVPPPNQYFQQQHQLSKKQQELLEYQLKHKMHLEECRRRINKAQKTIYAPTITPPRKEENSYGMVFELPKAGSRYKPSLPLTPIAFLGNAFPTKEEAFKPFQAKPLPTFRPAGPKPQAKPACAVQCVIPMKWHPPNQLINGQPYKYQPTTHQPNSKDQGEQEFLPPATPKPPKEIQRPVAHPLQPVPEPPYRTQSPQPQLSEDEIAEMMSANAEVIVGQTLGVNFQKYMPGFDHLKNSEVYRLVHGLED